VLLNELPQQDVEKGRQRRSRVETILNVSRGYTSGCFFPAALLNDLFEHPGK
jgi:hypothetical protein